MKRALLAVFALGGCTAAAPLPGPVLIPGTTGLGISESELEIGFGRTGASTLGALERLGMAPAREVPCGYEMEDGTLLVIEDGTFVGWQQDGSGAGRDCGD